MDPRFLDFLEDFRDSVRDRRLGDPDLEGIAPRIPLAEALTAEFLDRLEDGSDLPDIEQVGFIRQKIGTAYAQVDGYSYSDVDRRLDLVVAIPDEENRPRTESAMVPAAEIVAAAKRALHVYRSAAKPVYLEMEPASAAADMFSTLHGHHGEVTGIRVIVLVDGTAKAAEFEQPDGLPSVRLDVWDHVRLQRVCTSGLPYDPVTIDLMQYLPEPLPFVVSDVDVDDHECLVTILPGDLLHELYDEHGARLLELNVRSYLQARGKVNKGIRGTLAEDPQHFLAFNNGISATVEKLEYGDRPDGTRGIVAIRGLQIVNGGQTTASIHRARKQDKCDLSRVRVQAKITIVAPEYLDTLVPSISRFSNTQNKVNETDFSANHPYHVQVQQLSERVWAPGEATRWFYERARGQWEVARSREGTTPAKKRAFDVRVPKQQRIDKALLAKAVSTWDQKPHIVSRGGQKNFVDFMGGIGDLLPDEDDYKRIVAQVILFKATEKIARQLAFSAYRANAVTYTLALLSYRTLRRITLEQIWRAQSPPQAVLDLLRCWMPLVHECVTENALEQGKNVTEWAKSPACWAVVQNLDVEIPAEVEMLLGEGLPLPNVGAFRDGGAVRQLDEEEMRRQETVMAMSGDEYAALFKRLIRYFDSHGMTYGGWSAMTGCVTTLQAYAENGWTKIPTPKQTKQVLKAIRFVEDREGPVPE
jgi:hypothetical protein